MKPFFLKYKMSLYAQYFYDSEIEALFSEKETIALMLHFEGALALAQAENSFFPKEYAEEILACCKVEMFDMEQIKNGIALGGNAAIPLVKQLAKIVKNRNPEAAKFVHFGATSQDVVDTGRVLQIKKFLDFTETKLQELNTILKQLSLQHRDTLMIGRTLLQQAKPITFGLKTAKWLLAIQQNQERIKEAKKRILVLTLGGAVGSGNQFIGKKVQIQVIQLLDLTPLLGAGGLGFSGAELASILGQISGILSKIAKDVSLLMQTEVGEVFEGAADGKGGSSTMPHKRNPVNCTAILANGIRIPHLVASVFSSINQEHERSAGYWHAEWEVLNDIMRLSAGMISRSIELLSGLEVDKKRMLANLELTNGLIYAENVSLFLAKEIGKEKAHEIIEKACKSAISEGKHLKIVLQDLAIDNLNDLFKPENSIGNSLQIIDEILNKNEL
jgi:3-carboxy-cis,cis-muconate cycloisomerase